MAYNPPKRTPDPLSIPEIVANIINNVGHVPDLLNCACVGRIWNAEALRRLYEGSVHDMRFRTPDTSSLNCLLVASRERFARNMSFVRHLLVCPETHEDDGSGRASRAACFENCRATRNRRLIKLLLQPRGRRLTSLAIPFEFMRQDWSLLADLLPAPNVEFLAINHCYCRVVTSRITSAVSNGTSNVTLSDAARLLERVRRHRNLEALVLNMIHCASMIPRPAYEALEAEDQQSLWPKLKLLHLANCNQYWLRELPKFKELRAVHLGRPVPYTAGMSKRIGEAIVQCRHLQDIMLDFWKLEDLDVILGIARGCPLLRGVTIRLDDFREVPKLTKSFLFNLLRALPLLELLDIFYHGSILSLDGSALRDIALYCPRLKVLLLPWVRLCLSYSKMTQYYPQQRLEAMEFMGVWLRGRRQSMERNKILTEWRRIFPRLRAMPCEMVSMRFGLQNESDYSADEDMTLNEQGGCILGCSPDWETVHEDFLAALGYKEEDTFEIHALDLKGPTYKLAVNPISIL
ncbi:hypothetical protein MAC_09345 [Metarhizium acridum CQMa 102]|uniref:F-box domain-containing protein n=1 Tax=Metarhizium acridum (strain CQMa 102) TaxID=655827 RepID=E9EHJ7_METAQ|nr:uncharacterized protein MAC_09345 [Metarhizium acridum CQMa 102]EFY84596.1 hypothetical protein MAC_09345 [Metarhizium acridum CQMa 102]